MKIVSLAMLAFASFRQPKSLKERYMTQPFNNDTSISVSDIYLKNIEKMSKSRNNAPSYLDGLEKYARTKRKSRKQQLFLPGSSSNPIIIPIGMEIPRLFLKKKEQGPVQKNIPKQSESGQFVVEETHQFNFSNIGGYGTIKVELAQVADMMLNPSNYTQYNVRIPKGVLLEGPPGNGKTLLAKCFAGEIKCNFVRCVGSEFNEKYIGVGSARLRELFKFASENQPVVLFVDEFDAIGRKRSGSQENSGGEKDTTLNQLLVLMDGFENIPNMLIMAATNRIDILDPAVIRPGRFDKILHVPNPDQPTREEIIRIHKKMKPIEVDEKEIAHMTSGFSGAMIENLLNEATLWGVRNNELPIDRQKLDDIRQQIVFGTAMMTRNISETTQRRIAVHEIGHLINALVSDHYDKPVRVSINLSSKNSLGQTVFQREEEDEGIFVREYLDEKIRVLLGGRAAEEIIYGYSGSTGSLADLESAFQLTRRMIMEFGMGKHIVYPFLSEDYKKRIDEEIHNYIHQVYNNAKQTIFQNMDLFQVFVERLLMNGVITEEEIYEIFTGEENQS
jgi:cell division protease FtsH